MKTENIYDVMIQATDTKGKKIPLPLGVHIWHGVKLSEVGFLLFGLSAGLAAKYSRLPRVEAFDLNTGALLMAKN